MPVALDRVADGVWTLGSASGKPAPAATAATPVNPAARAGLQAAADRAAGAADVAAPAGRVEISNGNGATGLARRVSGFVAPASALRPRLTNDKPYGVRASRIQYVAGSERLAQEVNARLPSPLPLARAGDARARRAGARPARQGLPATDVCDRTFNQEKLMNDKPLLDVQNMPMWIVASFILALIALFTAFAGLYRTNMVLLATQAQVMVLNKKIDQSKAPGATAQLGAPAAPAAPVATTK